ncbi:hypothetical protein FSB73_07895 [Arachidicoccus ginsenosidivorans]|uniref:Tetratricopeptide repeat protein n=1 Tax=Arachidicoccus ginsenosidivorans TaxID=496057 RepID=A0A5B8VMZ6_9BACT|nr:hypothetical protein [Arachidicoccus ginsenosidivorans]QEC71598.1 hypothetical protein FSB73_07895 [Arachidicoccus ginsenosidivorans]
MTESNAEYIESYLNNDLSSDERAQFEARLRQDTGLQEDLDMYKQTANLLSRRLDLSTEERAFRESLNSVRSQLETTASVKTIRSKARLWVSIVAAAAIILFIWSPWQVNLLNHYGQLEMTSPVVRGDEVQSTQEQIAKLFNAKQYKEVVVLLDSAVVADPANMQNLFYRGISYLHLQDYQKARQDLKTIFDGSSVYKYEGAYFTALSFRIEKQNVSCRIWLQKIPKDAAIYPKAQKLLEETPKD